MSIQRPAALEALNTTLYKSFQEGLKTPLFSEVDNMATPMPSSTEFNTYGWLATMGGMREWIGARVVEGMKERAYAIYNKSYEKTIGVDRDKLDDGQVADMPFAMEQLAYAANSLEEDLLLALLEGGAAATVGGLAYDGQFFFDTDHPIDLDSSGSQRNYYASGLALDGPNLKAVVAAMESFKGENNRPLNIGSRGLVAVVPPALWGTLLDACEAKTVANGGENIIATKYNIRPVKWARLSSTTRWFVLDLASPGPKPFIVQRRKAPAFVPKTSPSDENVYRLKRYEWGVDARKGAGYAMWQKAFSAAA